LSNDIGTVDGRVEMGASDRVGRQRNQN
jgi:hypothetical protein